MNGPTFKKREKPDGSEDISDFVDINRGHYYKLLLDYLN